MPYLTPIFVRGINNLSDARYCAGMGADKLSFLLDPALPGALAPAVVKELAGWIAGVELIGEFDALSAPEINALAADCALDAVLLRRPRSAAELAEIAPPVLLELPANFAAATLNPAQRSALVGVVVELADGEPDVAALAEIAPLWLGPGLNPARAQQVVAAHTPAGLVFPAGDEIKPGLRDFDQLEAVFEALEEA